MVKTRFALHLVTLLVLLLPNLAGLAQAAPPADEVAPPHSLLAQLDGPAYLDTGLAQPGPAAAGPEYIAVPGSKLVFQSARDGNWEIYKSNDDGSEEVRLTYRTAADVHPRCNRGCTRIVFASAVNYNADYEIWVMNSDGSGLVQLTDDTTDDVFPTWSPDGTRIAFTSYRDLQAEIYVMNADGSGVTRLTYDADYDSMPAWSPDGSQIAFSSRRTGGYRIYAVSAAGGDPTMLSSQPYSESPVWSPDGTRIAYDADADDDGWQELMVMNADGSGQRQLYKPSTAQADAWSRGWSPDGHYLSFTEVWYIYQGGQWYWTDGWLNCYDMVYDFYCGVRAGGGADWHPDWQTTDLQPPASHVLAQPAVSPAPLWVRWTGSDAGGAGLRSYDIQVRDGLGGAWTDWLPATMETEGWYPGLGGHTYCFRSRARDQALNLEEWPAEADTCTAVEAEPPQTAVNALPRYTRGEYLNVSWGGIDPGGSGITTYDVQYQDVGYGAWVDWYSGTYDTQGQLWGAPGHTYAFRSRARDQALNLEEWPAEPDTVTTAYNWSIDGTVRDNHGTAVSGAQVTTAPAAFEAWPSAADGSYAAYVGEVAGSYGVTWSKPGYGPLPVTDFDDEFDAHLDVVLPPADNIVQDWDMEGDPAAWTLAGAITPVVTATLHHTGDYAALLGCQEAGFTEVRDLTNNAERTYMPQMVVSQAGDVHVVWQNGEWPSAIYYVHGSPEGAWSTPQRIDSPADGDLAYSPNLAVDGGGALHVLWSQVDGADSGFYYARRGTDGTWSTPWQLAAGASDVPPQLAVDGSNSLHAAWAYGGTVYYARRTAAGSWSGPEAVSGGLTGAGGPVIALDTGGALHLAFSAGDSYYNLSLYYARRTAGGSWSAPEQIAFPGTLSSLEVQTDDGNNAHVVWSLGAPGAIYYSRRDGGGAWSTPVQVGDPDLGAGRLDLAVEGDGTAHLVWFWFVGDTMDVLYAQRPADGTWTAPLTLTQSHQAAYPQLALQDDGTLHVTWEDWSALESGLFYARRSADGSWEEPRLLSSSFPASLPWGLAVAGSTVHVAWEGYDTYWTDVYYLRSVGSSETGDSSIAQVLTVPPTMTAATLSFLYQLDGASPGSGSWFEVTLDQGLTHTVLLSTTARTGDWAHASLDLSDWASRTVTLTLNVFQTAGPHCTWAYLDEVSLGSTYPDLWLEQRGPGTAAAGSTIVYTLRYGNRGGAPAVGAMLTATLPAELTVITASVAPITLTPPLRWALEDLPADGGPWTVVVTATVAPTVSWGSYLTSTAILGGPAELETANNVAQAVTFVGYRIYLPLVTR